MKDVISCESFGEEQISFDPEISEWGNPAEQPSVTYGESIAIRREPGELETSK